MNYQRISPEQALALREREAQWVDIRDEASFAAGHIPECVHLDNTNLARYLIEADHDRPLIVVCYHGNSSQQAAAYLAEQGFDEVYSLDGGFTLWQSLYPTDIAR